MPLSRAELIERAARFSRTPRVRRISWWIAGIVAFIAIAGFLIAPPLVKRQLEAELSAQLHRQTTIERVRINPFAFSVTAQGFVVRERGSETPALSFDELYASASAASLFRLAPVIKRLRLSKPYLHVVRNTDQTYNYQDLIDEFLAKPESPTPRFSLNNVEIVDGRIDFDDQPQKQQHQVTDIRLGIPFLSSLSYATNIDVQPAFSAKFDGAPFGITGATKPFGQTHQTTLNLDIDALPLPRVLEYSPVRLKFKLASGELDTKLKLSFATTADHQPHTLTVAGTLRLEKIDLREVGGAPLLTLPLLAADIDDLDVLGANAKLKSLHIDGVDAHFKRLANGTLNVMALTSVTPKAPAAASKPGSAKPAAAASVRPFQFAINDLHISKTTLRFEDQFPAKPARFMVQDLTLAMQGLSNARDAKASASLAFKGDALNTIAWTGSLQLDPLLADGKLDLAGLRFSALQPYFDGLLNLEIPQGTLDLATSFNVRLDGEQLAAQASDLTAAVKSLQARLPGSKDALTAIATLQLKGGAADLAKRTLTVNEIAVSDASASVVRGSDGQINLARIMKPAPAAANAKTAGAPWSISLKRFTLDRSTVDYQDLTPKKAISARVSQLAVNAETLSNAKGAKSQVRVSATVNKAGKLALAGTAAFDPLSLNLRVDATAVDLLPLQPLVEDNLNVAITSGALTAKGALTLELPPGAAARATYKGDADVTDFAAVDNLTYEDLLKWKSLRVAGIDAALDPRKAAVDEIALTEFYMRLIVNPDGTLNLQHVLKKADAPPTSTIVAPAAKPAAPPPAQPAAAAPLPPNLAIGKITLKDGKVDFSDHFIRPNYSADLSELTGSVSRMTADTPGNVELRGRVQQTAPLEITGRINPLARDLFLDIKASARDVELPPLTPYAAKYAGYGIEKGKLSMAVQYHLENRKLTAENHINLDQLTFGEKIDSPTATKLPVLLAVALLKDRNGVIDFDLPITGSIDDPQFSLGGVIVRVLVNLLVKAVTSPFALIGSLFGGGEELAYLEFAPGRAAITPDALKKLGAVAKALTERPALKMEITGRVDADSDREGLRRAALARKVKAQKLKDLLKGGSAVPSLDDITVAPGEYEKYLSAAYGDEKFQKPRNAIGLTRRLPAPEMEQLMLANTNVSDDELRELAGQRAQAIRDWLAGNGKISAERVFLVAPRLSAAGIKDKGRPNRADLALR